MNKKRGLKILTDDEFTEEINPDFTKIYSYKDSFIFEDMELSQLIIISNVMNKFSSKNDKGFVMQKKQYTQQQ